MEMQHGNERYWTTFVEDQKDGYAGYRLHREVNGQIAVAAEVIYWDASGGFTIQTFARDLQVEVAQALISEAQKGIKTR
jgi:hypothetical protein